MGRKAKNKAVCPNCGGTTFWITETLLWKGVVDADTPNVVDCFNKSSEIESITCKECDTDVSELKDNDKITFNFQ